MDSGPFEPARRRRVRVSAPWVSAPWWQTGAVYQIYPSSFADSNGDGLGDLAGITSRLDHLRGSAHSLGVAAIWLSPFYRSPMVDFGYDVADHCDVDPRFGTLRDFDALLAAAHARDLRVLIDFVPNHTSNQHPWFIAARSSRTNPLRDWYIWADPRPDGSPPNNWLSAFARTGVAWTFDEATRQYYLHSYSTAQPDLNWRNPSVVAAMQQVMRFWLDRGVDGFRVDAPHRLLKDAQLRDNPQSVADLRLDVQLDEQRHYNIDHPEVHEVIRLLRSTTDAYPGRVLIGEVGIRHHARWAAYHGAAGDGFHMASNFAFWDCPWSARCFRDVVDRTEAVLPVRAWPTYALSNHDLSRVASRYDQDGQGADRVRLAAMLLVALRGTPFLYYGEEIGMRDVAVPPDQAHDPDDRDRCRTPMQWDESPGAGFTNGTPWLPLPDKPFATVAAERSCSDSLLRLYQRLLRLRAVRASLGTGDYRSLDAGDDRLFAFERRSRTDRILAVFNFSATAVTGRLALDETKMMTCIASTSPAGDGMRIQVPTVSLRPNEGAIFA
jgi:alpha-glucosidase